MRTEFRIHPSVGIARVGDGEQFFVGPEAPGELPPATADGLFRESPGGPIRRQAARFRIFAFDFDDAGAASGVREVTSADAQITWTVHLVNRKSFTVGANNAVTSSVNDPGPRSVAAPGDSASFDGVALGQAVHLGRIVQEEKGTLLVIPAKGLAGSPTGAPLGSLRNAGWWDDVADGRVAATIRMKGGGVPAPATSAWVVTSVPGFGASVGAIVPLYDLAEDIAIRELGLPAPARVSFAKHVWPLLARVARTSWVNKSARGVHGPGRPADFGDPQTLETLADPDATPGSEPALARANVFENLRVPTGVGSLAGGNMPKLNGGVTLTPTQYRRMQAWATGDFDPTWNGPPPQPTFDELPVAERPAALDLAHLGSMVGGSFVPGIEVCDIVRRRETWGAPFRVADGVLPGRLTERLSIPWQDDFNQCVEGWWPSARLSWTTRDGATFGNWVPDDWEAEQMLNQWPLLGFVRRIANGQGGFDLRETERRLP